MVNSSLTLKYQSNALLIFWNIECSQWLLLADGECLLPLTRDCPTSRRNSNPPQCSQNPPMVLVREVTARISEVSAAGSIVIQRRHHAPLLVYSLLNLSHQVPCDPELLHKPERLLKRESENPVFNSFSTARHRYFLAISHVQKNLDPFDPF